LIATTNVVFLTCWSFPRRNIPYNLKVEYKQLFPAAKTLSFSQMKAFTKEEKHVVKEGFFDFMMYAQLLP
jgi:hypothetical protein